MHSAPAVSYPVGRSFVRVLLHLLPVLLGGVVCGGWFLASANADEVQSLVLLLWLVCAALALRGALQPARGQLAWDGQAWSWDGHDGRQTGAVHTRLDWQSGLLLEFQPVQGRGVWLWPERGMAPSLWAGLRRAVFTAPAVAPLAVPEIRA